MFLYIVRFHVKVGSIDWPYLSLCEKHDSVNDLRTKESTRIYRVQVSLFLVQVSNRGTAVNKSIANILTQKMCQIHFCFNKRERNTTFLTESESPHK
jgi:predicted GTPase